ncbi:MAG: DUF3826 domain-containing protein [Prevotellaceae bacterium]|jgi:hypothetical protein|nr:DUF3826 domain-containing protein [Prevotellaceae bacterium]
MKRFQWAAVWLLLLPGSAMVHAQSLNYENQFARPLGEVLRQIESRFGIRLKYEIDTIGKMLPYADFRIRPYSVEETLTNVLSPFDYKATLSGKTYKLKPYEYPRRTVADGQKMIAYLRTLYHDGASFRKRAEELRPQVRRLLGIDELLQKRVEAKPILSKIRKMEGYSVQNFALQTLPGLYVCGSIYAPSKKGKHPLILCPNGHFADGRYNKEQQIRMATLARMGAVCVDYDLFGWGESILQVGEPAHRTSMAHVMQALNGLSILDYMLSAARKDIDATRTGVHGGSGGGSQVVLLTALDDRFTAAAPVVSLASHFDGGCPCESGMPIQLAGGGTCNPEILAMFAPKPLLVVSDGGDWTASVPTLEFPYLQTIYDYFGAKNQVSNVHLPGERHDFGPNKRQAVYDFFARVFALDKSKLDEAKVTVEPREALFSFGAKGELLPSNALKAEQVAAYFEKGRFRDMLSDIGLQKKAAEWVASLQLSQKDKEAYATTLVYNHLRAVRDWHNAHPYTTIPEGINPATGNALSKLDREMIADSAMPKEVHEKLMNGLRKLLTEAQVEAILDKYTVGKVDFTLRGYQAIVPDLTEKETAEILKNLRQAREIAIDYKSMKQISAIFEIYKTKCEQYFNNNGRNWRQLFKAYVDKRNAEKRKAKEAQNKK